MDIGQVFELPEGAALHYSAHSPWAEDEAEPAIDVAAGRPYTFHLVPFQVLTLEALPR
jgi:hypothetical protein